MSWDMVLIGFTLGICAGLIYERIMLHRWKKQMLVFIGRSQELERQLQERLREEYGGKRRSSASSGQGQMGRELPTIIWKEKKD